MPPRGERMPSMDEAEPIPLVQKKETKEAIEAIMPRDEVMDAMAEVFAMQAERERAENAMTPEESERSLAMMDNLVAEVESRTDAMREAEADKEWRAQIEATKAVQSLADSINTAEQLTWEGVLESQKAEKEFEQIGDLMRLDVSKAALDCYEKIMERAILLGDKITDEQRGTYRELMGRLRGLIEHEWQITKIAQERRIQRVNKMAEEYEARYGDAA